MASFSVDNLGKIGLIADKEPQTLPPNAWSDLSNVRCEDRSISSFPGYSSIATISGTPETMVAVYTNTDNIVYGVQDKVYVYTGGAETEIGSGYRTNGYWDSCILGGVAILTNGIDNPVYWGGAGNALDLPYDESGTNVCYWSDVGMTAKIIRSFKYYLIAMNITDCEGYNPRKIHWSHYAEPGTLPITWDPTIASFNADIIELSDTPGEILDALIMSDTLQVYKDDAIFSLTYAGRYASNEPVFQSRLVVASTGLFARRCVCDVGGQHFFVGDGDIYIYDGNNLKSIADERVKDLFFNSVSGTQRDKAFCVYYERVGEAWLCYPEQEQTTCTKALVWDKNENTWSQRDLPNVGAALFSKVDRGTEYPWDYFEATGITWAEWNSATRTTDYPGNADIADWDNWFDLVEDEPFDDRLVMGSSTDLYEMDRTNQANGVNQSCYAERTHLDLGDKADWHMVTAMYIRASGSPFEVEVGTLDLVTGATTYSASQTFTPGTDYKLNFQVTGRLHSLKFSSSGNVSWKIEGYEVDFEPVGRF